jgi:alpha-pyrone synthase
MILNARIPDLIGDEIKDLLHRVGDKLQVDVSKIDNYAVHPGGKKILDSVKNSLGLMNNELELSYQVLQQYGNMSSPTILFLLKAFSGFTR